MLTVEDLKKIAKIMFDAGPRTLKRVGFIARSLSLLETDNFQINYGELNLYLIELLRNEDKITQFNKEEIEKMTAAEIMEKYCPRGIPLPGIDCIQDYNREITILAFPAFFVEIHNNIVIVK